MTSKQHSSPVKNIVLKPGQVVKVYQKVKEGGKERIQVFEGLIIDVKNKSGIHQTFTIRRVVDGVGVEKIFNVNSPFIDKIQIVKEAKVRRANLAYMRKRTGKAARMKDEKLLSILLGTEKENMKEKDIVVEKKQEDPVKA
jgi:large subunit ribosomal protein L19